MTADHDALATARRRVEALRASLQALSGAPVRLVETHISWVLLGETHAYKFKKPLRLPFIDGSTLAARRHFCEEELRLNRRLAPDVYLGVVEVHEQSGVPSFGGGGPVVDVAVKMRRFGDDALWSHRVAAGALGPRDVDRLAQRLASFHRDAAVAPADSAFGSLMVHQRVVDGVIEGLDGWHASHPTAPTATSDWPALRHWLHEQLSTLAPLFALRRRTGRVREGHGDLHLGNLLQLGDEATAFDGIEFDPELRWIDVLNDIAFVVMDLMAHGQRRLAFRFLNVYLDHSGDHQGVPLLRFYLVGRALVRAQVAAIAELQGHAAASGGGTADYLALASRLSRSGDARLAITHGLPGSGKSFVSQALLEAAGAIRVRSDVERKRLFGLAPLQASREHVPDGIYDVHSTARTYERLHDAACAALVAEWPVIVDAAFLRRSERERFCGLAHELGVPFAIVDCDAPLPLLRERLQQRQAAGGDPSEADVAVLERLLAVAEPLTDAERACALVVETAVAAWPDRLFERWRAMKDER